MSRIRTTTDIRPLADFRANLAAVLQQVQCTKRPVILIHHGRSAAVLVDADSYEAMQDRHELFDDVRTAEEQLACGEGISHTKAKAATEYPPYKIPRSRMPPPEHAIIIDPPGLLLGGIVGAHYKAEVWLPARRTRVAVTPTRAEVGLGMQLAF